MLSLGARGESARADLALCNAKGERYGLSLTEEQMGELAQRRVEALRATGRVEFGRGVLVELVTAFCDSPYLFQDTYDETIAELQDAFYRFKEDSHERIADQDLIDAMRQAFDHEACGSVEHFGGMSVERLIALAEGSHQDENEDWSEAEAYEEDGDGEASKSGKRDELDRVYEANRCERPDESYAAGFYDEYNELYRTGFDANSRIGGSSFR